MHKVEFKFIEDQHVRVIAGPHEGAQGQVRAIIRTDGERSYEVFVKSGARNFIEVLESQLELVTETVDLTLAAIDETT